MIYSTYCTYNLQVLLLCKLQIASDDHIIINKLRGKKIHQVTGEAAEDNLQLECCSVKINIPI